MEKLATTRSYLVATRRVVSRSVLVGKGLPVTSAYISKVPFPMDCLVTSNASIGSGAVGMRLY